MNGKICVLDRDVSELIAAGEVVDRPASVVKELVENSIDAGADTVTVEIKNGGITFIRISDNGCGISHEDVPKAFLRHATSKVSTKSDLESIATLGFRGEALAAVAAVAKVDAFTRIEGALAGTHYVIEGAEEKIYAEAGCPVGTTFLVKDIFYNTPARMKFLKKDVTEASAILSILEKLALSNPEISFKCINNGIMKLHTPGDGNLRSAIYAVLGKNLTETLIPISYQTETLQVTGFISKPTEARPSRSMQYFYVNGRCVRSKTCNAALEEGYKGSIMTGKYPACVLMVTINPKEVDVNVHPAKIEIKFSNEREVYDGIYFGVKSALYKLEPPAPIDTIDTDVPPVPKVDILPPKEMVQERIPQVLSDVKEKDFTWCVPVLKSPSISYIAENLPPPAEPLPPKEDILDVRLIGELFETYILAECQEKLILIDKHAAHERLIYEKLKDSSIKQDRQILLSPVTINVSGEEHSVLTDNDSVLEKLGFCIEPFGPHVLLVREIPLVVAQEDIEEILLDIAQQILKNKKKISPEKFDTLLYSVACRSAIKAHHHSSSLELQEIMDLLQRHKEIQFCPHGRPIAITFTKREIEKRFGRIV